jgi:D-alanyl-D-alanine carboxypeptidase
MSAWDVAIAARALMANPGLAAIVGMKTYRFTGPDRIVYQLASHNLGFLNSYPGAIGIKTGYTVPAGVCVAEEAVRGGRAMLAIVMNGVSPDQTAAMLLDKGFATPATGEARRPQLPAVREPRPVDPAPVRTQPRWPPPRPVVAAASPGAAAAQAPMSGSQQPAAVLGVLGGAAVLGVGAGLACRRLVRRRRHDPAGA